MNRAAPFLVPPSLEFKENPLPLMAMVQQKLVTANMQDLAGTIQRELRSMPLPVDLAGKSVAVGVGSRGLHELESLVRETVLFLLSLGAHPFIVPAMGSHGGATAEGQRDVLAGYGITREAIGVPVLSTMEVVRIGQTSEGTPVYCDKNAWSADFIVPINRIKPHTQFRAPTESGLLKMLAVGFGKEKGAAGVHSRGIEGLVTLIPAFAKVFLDSGKVLFGLGVVEDGRHRTARVRALPAAAIMTEEPLLLQEAWRYLPQLPVETLDMLILDRMGKDISGPGMDSSVTGRIMDNTTPDPPLPNIRLISALDITDASHGNAVGVGLADFISRRLLEKIDLHATYMNAIIGGFPVQGKIPMVMPDDRHMFQAASVLLGSTSLAGSRLIRADSTLDLEIIHVSASLLPEVAQLENIEVLRTPAPMAFDAQNNLIPLKKL